MAKATLNKTKQPKLVEKVTEVKEVTLVLSANEADALMSLLYKVGGEPVKSPRRHTDKIMRALMDAGIHFPFYCGEERDGMSYAEGSIQFQRYPYTAEELA